MEEYDMDLLGIVLNNLEGGLLILDSEGEVRLFNEEMSRIQGELCLPLTKAGIYSEAVRESSVGDRLFACVQNAALERIPSSTFIEASVKGGTLNIEVNVIPVTSNGKVTHIILFFKDTTAEKIFEKKLVDMSTSLSTLIERASAVIIGTDSQGYITEWNRFSQEVTGYRPREVYTKRITEVLTNPEYSSLIADLHQKALTGSAMRNQEIPILSKSGNTLTLLLSATVQTSPSGEPTGVIFVGQDITELTQYRESLEGIVQERTIKLKEALQKEKEAVQARSKFVSMVSHEFKNPLAAIGGYVEDLQESAATMDDGQLFFDKLSLVSKQIKHMRSMLEEVLVIEKGETPAIKPVLRKVSVSQFTSKIAEEVLAASRGSHRIDLNLNVEDDTMISDEKFLRNIFINLLNNAIKFSPGHSQVDFIISENENKLFFEIVDEGLGIPASDLETLFEPFHRSENVSHITGSGLGLSIVKKAVGVLGGTIKVTSEVGVGSKFTVILPKNSDSKPQNND